MTSIEKAAFAYCSSLKRIEFPAGITSIEDYTCFNCSNLVEVELPAGITSIGKCAFAVGLIYDLKNIFMKAKEPALIGMDSFDSSSISKIYVPYQSLGAYKSADVWSSFAGKLVGYDYENDKVVE